MDDFTQMLARCRDDVRFAPQDVAQDDVVALLRAALLAPSPCCGRSRHFVAVDDRGKLAALSRCLEAGAEWLAGVPLAVLVCGDPLAD
ncbi:MAG TPA: NAD(P)H nitroreductase, partial [Candidatus Avibacteroides faecavium]|nr:NAD(P)H nitroreductase [Candidatus Avibacteroides faecavium]